MVVSSMPCSVPPRPPSSCGAMVQSRFLRKGVSDLPQVRGDRERAAGGLHAAAHRRPREEGRAWSIVHEHHSEPLPFVRGTTALTDPHGVSPGVLTAPGDVNGETRE